MAHCDAGSGSHPLHQWRHNGSIPVTKSLDSFDFKAIPKLNKMQVLELARCEWIERRENVIALGPSGTWEGIWN
jgi:DNA replication protein DnaC